MTARIRAFSFQTVCTWDEVKENAGVPICVQWTDTCVFQSRKAHRGFAVNPPLQRWTSATRLQGNPSCQTFITIFAGPTPFSIGNPSRRKRKRRIWRVISKRRTKATPSWSVMKNASVAQPFILKGQERRHKRYAYWGLLRSVGIDSQTWCRASSIDFRSHGGRASSLI